MTSPPSAAPPQIPVSWGELIDKITILRIKRDNIESEGALRNVLYELSLLEREADSIPGGRAEIAELEGQLRAVNEKLWDTENRIREKEANQEFDAEFITLARSIYQTNDARSALKKSINEQLCSPIVEEKSYSQRAMRRASERDGS